jgi:hypothetical protein
MRGGLVAGVARRIWSAVACHSFGFQCIHQVKASSGRKTFLKKKAASRGGDPHSKDELNNLAH